MEEVQISEPDIFNKKIVSSSIFKIIFCFIRYFKTKKVHLRHFLRFTLLARDTALELAAFIASSRAALTFDTEEI